MKQPSNSRNEHEGVPRSRSPRLEVEKFLPEDLLTEVTVLFQDSGYVTISPRELTKSDWYRINESVKEMGGLWISNDRFSHWSIPFPVGEVKQSS